MKGEAEKEKTAGELRGSLAIWMTPLYVTFRHTTMQRCKTKVSSSLSESGHVGFRSADLPGKANQGKEIQRAEISNNNQFI